MLARYEKDYLPFTRNGREYDFEEELMHLGMMKKAKERKEHDDFMTGLFGLAALAALKESLGGEEKETNRDDGDEHLRSPFPFDLTDCELSWDEDHLESEEMDFEPEPQEFAEFLKALFEEMEKEHEEKDDRDDKKDDDDRRSPVSLDDVSCLHSATTCCHGHDCDKETVPDSKSSIFGTEVEPVGAAMEFPVYCIFDHEKKTTTAFWSDGEKTVVTADAEDKYDPFLGVMYCCMEHASGGKDYLNHIRKLVKNAEAVDKLYEKFEQEIKERKEIEARKRAKRIATKARRKKKHEVEVMKEALLQLKEEGLL